MSFHCAELFEVEYKYKIMHITIFILMQMYLYTVCNFRLYEWKNYISACYEITIFWMVSVLFVVVNHMSSFVKFELPGDRDKFVWRKHGLNKLGDSEMGYSRNLLQTIGKK